MTNWSPGFDMEPMDPPLKARNPAIRIIPPIPVSCRETPLRVKLPSSVNFGNLKINCHYENLTFAISDVSCLIWCSHLPNVIPRSPLGNRLHNFTCQKILLWHVEPLLGNHREMSSCKTAVTRQRPVNSNKGTVFSVRSVPRCYKQGKSVRRWWVR
jgi:hypothetical protein